MGNLGKLLVETFEGMRHVIVLASRSKQPDGDLAAELAPHCQLMLDGVKEIRALKLEREFDNHMKAVMEMLACISWVNMRAPAMLPAPFVKECVGSAEFWSNRVRKDFKGVEAPPGPSQIAFCDGLKKLLQDLASYIEEHHKTGLTFNPKGVSLAESAIVLTDNPIKEAATAAVVKSSRRSSAFGNTIKGGNILGLMSELSSRKNEEGSSAATGLRHVSWKLED